MKRIRITAGPVTVEAELAETACARAIWEVLPFSAYADTWGDEIYFSIPVVQPLDGTAAEVVALGDIGYWPPGQALCIFFGPTPISTGEEIRPASAVNIVGKVKGDPTVFRQASDRPAVSLEKIGEDV